MPYDGVIETIPADAQEVVSAGQEVMTLQGESGMEFKIGLPAADVGKVELGMKATVTVRSLAGAAMSAEVIKVAAQPSENSTYEVTLALNGDMDPQLRSGMDGEAELKLPNAGGSVISVPIECVVGRGSEDTYVWLVEGEADAKQIRKGPVTTGGLAGEGQVEVQEGLKPGDVIVSRGVHRVEEGMAVAVTVEK
jgi:RND family efflux transporter MFP subunit